MMVTDEQRKQVATELRSVGHLLDDRKESLVDHALSVYSSLIYILCNPSLEAGDGVFDAMANLIEPVQSSSEPTSKRDQNEQLELANEMVEMFRIGAFTGEGIDRSWCRELYDKYAMRFREVFGEAAS